MRLSWVLPLILSISLFSCGDNAVDDVERENALFVQNANSGTFNGKEITLNTTFPVIYFTQEPKSEAGSITTADFTTLWTDGQDTLANSTKGILSLHTPQGDKHVTVELMNPKISGDQVTYKVRILLGNIPRQFGESTLFIDFGETWEVPQGGAL